MSVPVRFGVRFTRKPRYWMVCDTTKATPCLFDEDTALRLGDPPRCIRHDALLFSDTSLNGLSREDAKKRIRYEVDLHRDHMDYDK
jgi:hypothetical protein